MHIFFHQLYQLSNIFFAFGYQIYYIFKLMFCGYLLHVKIGEDKDYSVTASVELKKLFPNKKVRVITTPTYSSTCHVYFLLNKLTFPDK